MSTYPICAPQLNPSLAYALTTLKLKTRTSKLVKPVEFFFFFNLTRFWNWDWKRAPETCYYLFVSAMINCIFDYSSFPSCCFNQPLSFANSNSLPDCHPSSRHTLPGDNWPAAINYTTSSSVQMILLIISGCLFSTFHGLFSVKQTHFENSLIWESSVSSACRDMGDDPDDCHCSHCDAKGNGEAISWPREVLHARASTVLPRWSQFHLHWRQAPNNTQQRLQRWSADV